MPLDATTAQWDFPIEIQPVYTKSGMAAPNHKAVVNADTGDILGVHGLRYKPIHNGEFVDKLLTAAEKVSKDYKANYYVSENGARLRYEIIFPDINITPVVDDVSSFRITGWNSYDGALALQVTEDAFRWWCANGCVRPDSVLKTFAKHTTNISIDGLGAKFSNAVEMFFNQEEVMRCYMRSPVHDLAIIEDFFKHTLASVPVRGRKPKTNEKLLNKMMGYVDAEVMLLGKNMWAVYNAMTYWASHTDDSRSPETAIRNRSNAVATALRSDRFTELLSV